MKKSLRLTFGLAVACLMCSCGGPMGGSGSETTTPVWLSEITLRTIQEKSTTTGTAKAKESAEISSEIEGKYYLQNNPKTGKPYRLGDVVEAGAVVVRLENREHEIGCQIDTKTMQVDIAEKEWIGEKALLAKGGTTEKSVLTAESSHLSAITSLENAQLSLDKLNIRAPFKGYIVKLPYFPEGVIAAANQVMLGVMNYSEMYMEINLPESSMESVREGQKVIVTNYNIKSDTLKGVVAQLAPVIDETTRTYAGFITIENSKLLLRPGMFTKAEIVTKEKHDVPAVEKNIITNRRGNQILYTVERNMAEERVIETGITDGEYIEILSGVAEGDQVVSKGYDWLRNRSRVKIMQ